MTPEQYDAWYDSLRGRWIGATEYRMLRGLLDPRAGDRALDVGCGTGWFTRRLAADGVDVTGLDKDRAALQFARGHAAAGERCIEGDAFSLPFADRAFDLTLSVTALRFVQRWPQAIAEIARVSRRRFVLGPLNRHSLLRLRAGRKGGRGGYAGAHWHTRSELRAALAPLALRQTRYRYGIFVPSGTAPAMASERLIPRWVPLGAFMAVCGDARDAAISDR
jgi:SAM-dependent methyltransferase